MCSRENCEKSNEFLWLAETFFDYTIFFYKYNKLHLNILPLLEFVYVIRDAIDVEDGDDMDDNDDASDDGSSVP